ncbi:hypothetical protein ACEUCH_10980 [Aeromonas hydrophila]|uniref:hypothetical protein n=1 Tax=Aeromonas hydrophila TaxID=644 RepID=UPI0038D16DBD
MIKFYVEDISRETIQNTIYDICIFSTGFESRSCYIPSLLTATNAIQSIVLCYTENTDNEQRELNDAYFKNNYKKALWIELSQFSTSNFSKVIHEIERVEKDCISILIDYSSMSRTWYSLLTTYILKISKKKFIIDFTYSAGEYESNFFEYEMNGIKTIPGCEGVSLTKKKHAAIFSLGFDRRGPVSVYDKLDPNICFGIIASPAIRDDYVKTAMDINEDFIKLNLDNGNNLLKLPLSSVATTFSNMCQIISPLNSTHNISIIPFGPKPHVLASILCSIKYDNIACIYSQYKNRPTSSVVCTGDVIITRLYKNLL